MFYGNPVGKMIIDIRNGIIDVVYVFFVGNLLSRNRYEKLKDGIGDNGFVAVL